MNHKVVKSAWQQDTEKQLTDMDYEIRKLREENDELRRMIGNITIYLCGVKQITVKDVSHDKNNFHMGDVA